MIDAPRVLYYAVGNDLGEVREVRVDRITPRQYHCSYPPMGMRYRVPRDQDGNPVEPFFLNVEAAAAYYQGDVMVGTNQGDPYSGIREAYQHGI